MGNSTEKKTIGIYVDKNYQFKGKEVKKEVDDFFNYLTYYQVHMNCQEQTP